MSSNLGLPVTTYTVSGVNLTSEGGTASESFTFTISYTATTNGVTAGTPVFSSFGNVGVGTGGIVSGAETLTATISLTSTSFAGLSLTGFTKARAGGFTSGETGTFTWQSGGTDTVEFGSTISNVSGNSVTLTAIGASTLNFEGFEAQFSAVPEPAATTLLGMGTLALLRRRRTA
jgi:MYXO-CTERM domain-containing protein